MCKTLVVLAAFALCLSSANARADDDMLNVTQHPKSGGTTTLNPGASAAPSGTTAKKTSVQTLQWQDVPIEVKKAALTNITSGQTLYKVKCYVTTGDGPKGDKTTTVYEFQVKNPNGKVGAMWLSDEAKWVGQPKIY
jgi:hypothetical protein